MQVYVEIDQFRALLNRYKTDGKYQCVHQNKTLWKQIERSNAALGPAANAQWETSARTGSVGRTAAGSSGTPMTECCFKVCQHVCGRARA
jgi:hypothetical protein